MFLYMLPLVGVFVAAFFNPTNAVLTYTALGMALGPQVFTFGIILPNFLRKLLDFLSQLVEKVKKIVRGFSKIYSKIMQPEK